jgi:hypothetical protein
MLPKQHLLFRQLTTVSEKKACLFLSCSNSSCPGAYHDPCLHVRLWLQSQGKQAAAYDPTRTLRMLGYGLLWYGPYQYYWYNLLDFFMPVKNTVNFLTKVQR